MVFRASLNHPEIEIVGINDLCPADYLAYMLKYDTMHGKCEAEIGHTENAIIVNGKEIPVSAERNPADLPWAKLGAEYVVESTGLFLTKEKAQGHLDAGAKKVVITCPAKDEDITIVMGVNDDQYDPEVHNIISNASCTTNCLAPFAKVLLENFGIKRGYMNTIHSYTNDQKILDLPHKDLRRARAAAMSMIPTTTGAAKAVIRAAFEDVPPAVLDSLEKAGYERSEALLLSREITAEGKSTCRINGMPEIGRASCRERV